MNFFKTLFLPTMSLFAAPSGLEIVLGEALFCETAPSHFEAVVSDQAILNWDTFSIEQNETVNFLQPSSQSLAVNRVVGISPSSLFGTLSSNGKLVLVNPNGVLFGEYSRVDTGSFIASSLQINEKLFEENRSIAFSGQSNHSIKNLGHITANEFAYLIGSKIEHSGRIEAANAGLISQNNVQISLIGEINFSPISGIKDCLATLDGTLRGEKLFILGDLIEIGSNAHLRAVAKCGGGTIEIGSLPDTRCRPSELTYVSQGAYLDASAEEIGNGGEISIWGAKGTQFFGSALARGGSLQGNGGKIEVSALGGVEYRGFVDTTAPRGKTGQFILDPCDIFINAIGAGTSVPPFSATYVPGINASVSITDIGTAILGSNVSLNTSPGGGGSGDITWDEFFDLTYSSANSLTFNADQNVTIRSNVTNMGIGDIIVNAGGAVFIGDAANTTIAQISTLGNVTVDCVSGFTVTAGNGAPANAGISAGGTAAVNVSNGNFHLDAVTNSDSAAINGAPVIVIVPQGSVLTECANSGTTGFGFTDYLSIVARDNVTFLSATSGRNEIQGSTPGIPSLIESTTGDVILHNTSGQRLRFVGDYPLTIRAARDFTFESNSPGGFSTIQVSANPVIIDAGRDILFRSTLGLGPSIFLSDTFFANAGRDILLDQTNGNIAIFTISGVDLNAAGSFTANVISGTSDLSIATTTSGPISITSGGNTDLFSTSQGVQMQATDGIFSIIAGGNITYSGTSLLITVGDQGVLLDSGANINLLNAAEVYSSGTDILLRANISIQMGPNSIIDFLAPLVPGSTVTLVVDDEFPSPPLFGAGSFVMNAGAQILTAERAPVAIFSSQQQLNSINGSINGTSFSQGTLYINTNEEQWCTYYPNGPNIIPFRVYYKTCLQEAASEASLIVTEILTDLHPYNEFPGWREEFSLSAKMDDYGFTEPYFVTRRQLKVINQPKTWTVYLRD